MEIVGKKSTDLQPEGALDGSNRKPYGILYYLNFTFFVLLMLAFILYYLYMHTSVNIALMLFFVSMFGLMSVNCSSFLVRKGSLLTVAMVFLVYSSFMLMIWINDPNNEPTEVLKSSFFHLTAITTLVVVYYSSSISQVRTPVAKAYETLLVVSSVILIVQMIANFATGIVLAFPWQPLSSFLFRPSGLFGEPAHFGQFSAGLIMLSQHRFEAFVHRKWKFTVVLLANLLSFSAFAYIVLFFILLRYLVLKTLVKRILFVVLISLATLVLTSVLDELPQFQRVNASYRGEASSVSRVTKGAILYSSLPIKEQLFGVGLGMGERSLSYYYGSDYSFLALSGGYMNAFFVELVNIGLIGALFLNIFYLLLFVRGDNRLIKYGAFMTMRLGGAVTLTSVMCVLWLLLLIIDSEK